MIQNSALSKRRRIAQAARIIAFRAAMLWEFDLVGIVLVVSAPPPSQAQTSPYTYIFFSISNNNNSCSCVRSLAFSGPPTPWLYSVCLQFQIRQQ